MGAPLSDADKANIRWYLGWGGQFFLVDSQLEQAMNAVASDNNLCTLLQNEIAACQTVDAEIDGAHRRLRYEQAEEIKYRGMQEVISLRSEGRRHVSRISLALRTPVRGDVYGGANSPTAGRFQFGMFADQSGGGLVKMG